MSLDEQLCSTRSSSIIRWASLLLLPVVAILLFDSINYPVFFWANQNLVDLTGEALWVVLTNLGDGFFLFPLTMLLFVRKPETQLSILLTMLIGALIINIGKPVIDVARPVGELGRELVNVVGPVVRSKSFPSGHAGTVFLIAGLALVHIKSPLRWLVVLVAALSAVSRVAVGAHWPVDIFMGAWIGLVSAAAGSILALRSGTGFKTRIIFILLGLLCAGLLPFYKNGFEPFGYVTVMQYLLAVISLLMTIKACMDLFNLHIREQLFQEGTLLNRLFTQFQRFIKFGLVGASGFVVDMGIYTLLGSLLGVPHLLARGGSYWVAASWNWFWNRTFTFSNAPKDKKAFQWGKYLSMCLVSFFPNWGTYYLMTTYVPFFSEYKQLALVAGVLAGMFFNFTFASLFIFSGRKTAAVGSSR
ncbi:MAG: GtrA family protein [Endozoicomonas sp.]